MKNNIPIASLAAMVLSADMGHSEFQVSRARAARIAWINPDFASIDSQGVTAAAKLKKSYSQWLLDECAYSTETFSADGEFHRRNAIADRYGGVGIGHNGGSGRAAVIGNYHVKGIGLTPLVGRSPYEADADGICTLEEAVREAIFSEICRRHAPLSAIPVLAILLLPHQLGSNRPNRAAIKLGNALIVRPLFIRPAHFERAYGFVGGSPGEDGVRDSKRVKAIFAITKKHFDKNQLSEMFRQFVIGWHRQLAFCFIHRLQHGQPLTSNVSIDGRLLDFGAMSSVSSWGNISTSLKWTPLRAQLIAIERQSRALSYYFGQSGIDLSGSIVGIIREGMEKFWDELVVQFLTASGIRPEIFDRVVGSIGRARLINEIASIISHYQGYRMDWTADGERVDCNWDFRELWNLECPAHLRSFRCLLDRQIGGKQRRHAIELIGQFSAPRLAIGRSRIRDEFSAAFSNLEIVSLGSFEQEVADWIKQRIAVFPTVWLGRT